MEKKPFLVRELSLGETRLIRISRVFTDSYPDYNLSIFIARGTPPGMFGAFPSTGTPGKQPYSVFALDDSVSDLEQCKRCLTSPLPLQRHVYVKQLTSVARSVSMQETIAHLMPLAKKLVEDPESMVRAALAEELGKLAEYLSNPSQPETLPVHYDELGHELPSLSAYRENPPPYIPFQPSSKCNFYASPRSPQPSSSSPSSSPPVREPFEPADPSAAGYEQIKLVIIPAIQNLLIDQSTDVRQVNICHVNPSYALHVCHDGQPLSNFKKTSHSKYQPSSGRLSVSRKDRRCSDRRRRGHPHSYAGSALIISNLNNSTFWEERVVLTNVLTS